MPQVAAYMKNVGKSIGYSVIEEIKNSNPAITGFVSSNKDVMKSAYTAIAHMDETTQTITQKVLDSSYGKLGVKAVKNIREDIKTGKFYNLERKRASEAEAIGTYMNDEDFGFEDFDMDSFDFDADMGLDDTIDLVGKKSSQAVSQAILETTEYSVGVQTDLARAAADQNKAIYANLHSGMNTINQNLTKLIEMGNGPLTTHMENSQKFYENETKLSEERNSILKEILELQKGVYGDKNKYKRNDKITMNSILDENGMPDLEIYFERIKQNIKDMSSGTGDMVKELMDSGIMQTFVASPLEAITNGIAKVIVPNALKSAMKGFNQTLGGMFSTVMAKINSSDSMNPVMGFIKNIFGVKDTLKKDIYTGNYEKGAVPFDGIVRKSIVEVIPTYLARIESALTRKEERRYNFETGKFMNISDIEESFKKKKGNAVDMAGMDIKLYLDQYLNKFDFGKNKDRQKALKENIDRVMEYSFDKGMIFNPRDREKTAKSLGLKGKDAENDLIIIRKMFESLPRQAMMSYAQNLAMAKENLNSEMKRIELSGHDISMALFNDSLENVKNGVRINKQDNTNQKVDTSSKAQTQRGKGRKWKKKNKNKKSNSTQNSKDDSDAASSNYFGRGDIIFSDDDITTVAEQAATAFLAMNDEEEHVFLDKINDSERVGEGVKKLVNRINDLIHKPTDFIAGIIKKADIAMYEMIFGVEYDENGQRKSVSAAIFDGLKEQFKDFNKWMKGLFKPVREYFNREGTIGNKAKKFAQGIFKKGTDSEFAERMKATGKGALGYVKNTVVNAGEKAANAIGSPIADNTAVFDDIANGIRNIRGAGETSSITGAASGMRKVNKTGIVAVSEGEMIIPPDLNPYNIDKRTKNENKAKKAFVNSLIDKIPEFGAGTENVDFSNNRPKISIDRRTNFLVKQLAQNPERVKNILYQMDPEARSELMKNLGLAKDSEYAKATLKNLISMNIENVAEGAKNKVSEVGRNIKNAARRGLDSAKNGGSSGESFSPMTEEQKEMVTSAMDEIKRYAPEVAAGSLIGTGVSFLTGAIGGPLLGAAVGGGIALLKNSEKVNEMLFGKLDEDGKRQGGLLSKELSQNFQKYAPAMGKGATLGAITTLLPFVPGGPMAGILLGSAIGFASQNEEIKNNLFGEEGLWKDGDKKIKKALPAMGLGAAAGFLAGPFGMVPNLLLGSAAGLAVSTDKFKDMMFGKEEDDGSRKGGLIETAVNTMFKPLADFTVDTAKGLTEWAKKNIKQPLVDAIDPVKKQFSLMFQTIHNGINKLFEDTLGASLDKMLQDYVFKPMTSFIKKVTGVALAPLKFIVSAPFKMIGGVGDFFRNRQIKHGNADYMTADERLAFRDQRGWANNMNITPGARKWKNIDKALSDMNGEAAGEIASKLGFALDKEKELDRSTKEAYNKFSDKVRHNKKLTARQVNMIASKIQGYVKDTNGDVRKASEKAHYYIEGLKNLSNAEKRELKSAVNEYLGSMEDYHSRARDFGDNKQKFIEALQNDENFKRYGIENIKEKDLPKILNYLRSEEDAKSIKENGEESLNDLDESQAKRHEELIQQLEEINATLASLKTANTRNADTISTYLDDEYDEDATHRFRVWGADWRGHIAGGAVHGIGAGLRGIGRGRRAAWHAIRNNRVLGYHDTDNARYFRNAIRNGYTNRSGITLTGSAAEEARRAEAEGTAEISNAAAGMERVDKTGVIAVSEGEMIIPPDLNPFNIKKRKKNEDEAKKKFIESIPGFAEGGTVGGNDVDDQDKSLLGELLQDNSSKSNKKDDETKIVFDDKARQYKYRSDGNGGLVMDTSDSETVKSMQQAEEEREEEKGFFRSMMDMPKNMLSNIKEVFTGDEKEEKKGGILGKIISKVTGIGGDDDDDDNGILGGIFDTVKKFALPILGIPLAIEGFRKFLQIDTNGDGVTLGDKLKQFATDLDIPGKLKSAGTYILDWFGGTGEHEGKGFPKLLQAGIEHWANGFEWFMTNVVPTATEIIIKALPKILGSAVSAIGALFKEGLNNIRFAGRPSTVVEDGVNSDIEDIVLPNIKPVGGSPLSEYTGKQTSWGSFMKGWTSGGDIKLNSYNGPTMSVSDNITNTTTSEEAKKANEEYANKVKNDKSYKTYDEKEAFNNLGNVRQKKITEQLEKRAADNSNVYNVTTKDGTSKNMTLQELLVSDEVIGYTQDPETGESTPIKGSDILKYPELAQTFGLDMSITDEERQAEKERRGEAQPEPTILGMMGKATVKKFLRGSTKETAFGKIGRSIFKHSGKANVLAKGAGLALQIGEKTSNLAGALGQKILPSWMRQGSKKIEKEAAEIAAKKAAEEGVETAAKKASKEVAEKAAKEGLEEATEKGAKKVALKSADEILEKASKNAAGELVTESGIILTGGIGASAKKAAKKEAGEAAEKVAKEGVEKAAKNAAKKGAGEAASEAVEKATKEGAENLGSKIAKAATTENKGLISKAIEFMKTQISKLFKSSTVKKNMAKAMKESGKEATEEAVEKATKELAEKLTEKLGKVLGEKMAKAGGKLLAKVGTSIATAGASKVFDIVTGFISGWNNANSIIGTVDEVSEPSGMTKLACAIVSALNEAACYGLLPLDMIFDFTYPILGEIFKIDTTKLTKDREESAKIVAEYNEKHDTNLTVEEYNKKDRLSTKLVNGVKGGFNKAKEWLFGSEEEETDKNGKKTTKKKKGALAKAASVGKGLFGKAKDALSTAMNSGANSEDDVQEDRNDLEKGANLTLNSAKSILPKNADDSQKKKFGLFGLVKSASESAGRVISSFRKNDSIENHSDEMNEPSKKQVTSILNDGKAMSAMVNTGVRGSMSLARGGKINEYFKLDKKDEKSNPYAWVDTSIKGTTRFMAAPIAMTVASGKIMSRTISDLLNKGRSVSNNITKDSEKLSKYYDKKDTKDFWTAKGSGGNNLFSSFEQVMMGVNRILQFPFVIMGQSLSKVTSAVKTTTGKVKDAISNAVDKVTSSSNSKKDGDKKKDKDAKGTGLMSYHARGTGEGEPDPKYANDPSFVSQLDSRYANKSFNVSGDSSRQTIRDTGCGPAAAAMVVNNAYEGNNVLDMKHASRDALKYKVKDGGVNAAYFEDEFSKHGLSTKYMMEDDPSKTTDIINTLRSGNRTVLMGKDPSNSSKKNSPYGPNDHYIVATRMSDDGKYIWVNDPESRRPEVKYPAETVLNNTRMGIAGTAASGTGLLSRIHARGSSVTGIMKSKLKRLHGRGKYGTDTIQYKVWTKLRGAGLSEYQVAGIMGNMYAESGFDPNIVEAGNGIGFGLCQWSYGRRTQIEQYAASVGKSAGDLDVQLKFLLAELNPNGGCNGYAVYNLLNTSHEGRRWTGDDFNNASSVEQATKAFCYCWERPNSDLCHMEKRLTAANEYYEEFTGTAPDSSGMDGDDSSSESNSGTILDKIFGVFDDLAVGYGLKSKGSSSSSDSGGVVGGNDKQKALVEQMKSVEGKLAYSQVNRDPEQGSADCSSTVQWAYKKVLGVDPGSWTGAMETDDDTYVVTTSFDESKMQPGDEILYDGHVEMYAGDGKMIGHGGGPNGTTYGPTISPLSDQGRFRMLKRWVGFKNGGSGEDASGSGLISKINAMGTGLNPDKDIAFDDTTRSPVQRYNDKAGFLKKSRYPVSMKKNVKVPAAYYAAGSNTPSLSTNKAPGATSYDARVEKVKSDDPSAKLHAYLDAIYRLMCKEVENTALISTIVTILTELVKISEEERTISGPAKEVEQKMDALNTRRTAMLNVLKATGVQNASNELTKLMADAERLARL